MARFLDHKHFSSKSGSSGFSNKIHIQLLPDQLSESSLSKHLTCVSRTYSQPQPVTQVNLHTSLCLSPDKLSESHLSKHLTCVSRTHSQPQPVEISQTFQKHVVSGNRLTSHLHQMTLQPTCPQEVKQNTSPESRILKLFDALDFTSAMSQPSVDCKSLVQAQHRSSAKIQELSTNDLSFTLDGVLSTLQQGSAENGVGSSVELEVVVRKRNCGMRAWRVRFALSVTLVHERIGLPHV